MAKNARNIGNIIIQRIQMPTFLEKISAETMRWQPIETYKKPKKILDITWPKALFYSREDGIVIGRCLMLDDDPVTYVFHFGREGLEIKPTHWMPLPKAP